TSDISINSSGVLFVALRRPSPDRWPSRRSSLSSADATLHGVWEMQFNECAAEGTLPTLHGQVWREVRSEHDKLPKALRLEVAHSWGLVHRLVDNRRAGWVTHWRQIASGHADD
ncbi:hypothetical protein AB0905_36135, partial [Streptomyces microflavus]